MDSVKFKFLEDRPLGLSVTTSQLMFGHAQIVKTLSQIVETCPAPFTIGLFAKWGAGKSTIAHSLKGALRQQGIPVAVFDVWKHEGDALRRTFLKDIVRQLHDYGVGYFPQFELNDSLEKNVVQKKLEGPRIEWEKLKKYWWAIPAGIGGLVLISLITHRFPELGGLNAFFYGAAGAGIASPVIIWLAKKAIEFFSAETTIYGIDRFSDPFQFEEEFSRVLRNIKKSRILIVFDNLDRVPQDKVIEVLSTIKTFLEPSSAVPTLDSNLASSAEKEVIFLIPCDASAIKQHLSNVYGSKSGHSFDADEFLRKFFNSILWIPDFIQSELETFATASLKETGVDVFDNDYVAWVITKAFRNNPRQVIQFVNILLANYLLIREREGVGKDFPAGFLQDNMPQLAKYLVLTQLFPEEMVSLRKKRVLNLQSVTQKDLVDLHLDGEPVADISKRQTRFLDFIGETLNIPISDLGIFFTLRRSEGEKRFPGFDSFVIFLKDKKLDDAKKQFLEFGEFIEQSLIHDFGQAIKKTLDEETNLVSLVTLIDGLLAVLDENGVILTDTVNADIYNVITLKCKSVMYLVSPRLIDRYLLLRYPRFVKAIVSLWIGVVDSYARNVNDQIELLRIHEIIDVVSTNFQSFDAIDASDVKTLLAGDRLKGDLSLAQIIVRDPKAQLMFLSSDYVNEWFTRIPNIVSRDELKQVLEMLNDIVEELFDLADPVVLLKSLTEIQLAENQVASEESRGLFGELFKDLVVERQAFLNRLSDAHRDPLIAAVLDCYNKISNVDTRSILIPVLLAIRHIAPETRVASIDDALSVFVASAAPAKLRTVIEGLSMEDRSQFYEGENFLTQFGIRAVPDSNFRNEFFKDLTPLKKEKFVRTFLSSQLANAIQFVGSLDKEDARIKLNVFRELVATFDTMPSAEKTVTLTCIGDYIEIEDPGELEPLARVLGKVLFDGDPSLQQLGLKVIEIVQKRLPEPRVRQVTKEIFDQLGAPTLVSKYLPSAVWAVFLGYFQLNEEEKGTFQQFVFDDLIRKGHEVPQIALGFAVLEKMKLNYETRSKSFDDLLLRIEDEKDLEVRTAVLIGLKSLMPDVFSDRNTVFWESVKALA